MRLSKRAADWLNKRAEVEGRSVGSLVDAWLGLTRDIGVAALPPVPDGPTDRSGAGADVRRAGRTRLRGRPLDEDGAVALTVERVDEATDLCACGDPRMQHRPKCLRRGCGCLGFRKPTAG